jgi:hypothetical protein
VNIQGTFSEYSVLLGGHPLRGGNKVLQGVGEVNEKCEECESEGKRE